VVFETFSVEQTFAALGPLVIFSLGMVAYAVFVFHFYRYLARKDIIELDLEKHNRSELAWLKKTISVIFYMIQYVVLFPIMAFFWFGILVLLLTFLAKNQTLESILLISMALVAAVRITAYYHEDLSRDLAKMLPFALLGVFLVDISYFSLETALAKLPNFTKAATIETVAYYLLFTIVLEFTLRIIHSIVVAVKGEEPKTDDD